MPRAKVLDWGRAQDPGRVGGDPTLYDLLKHIHIACALLSLSGFALRGYWLMRRDPRLGNRLTRVVPHLVDTLVMLNVSPFAFDWLSAKLTALLVYIVLGMVALRFGRSHRLRVGAFWLALATGLYIISVAYTKSPMGGLAVGDTEPFSIRGAD